MTEIKTSTGFDSKRASRLAVRIRRLVTLVAASLAAFAVWAVSVPGMGIQLQVTSGGGVQTVDAVSVLIVPLVAGGAAWGVLAVFERLFANGARSWRIVGVAVLALSLLGPANLSRTTSTMVVLLTMHLVVGAVLIVGLAWPARRTARTLNAESGHREVPTGRKLSDMQ